MSEDNKKSMTILDQMIADDNLQMMKAALPYVAPSGQRMLSIFTKFFELQKTMSLFQNTGAEMSMMSQENHVVEPLDMLNDIRQYAPSHVQANIDSLINTLSAVQLMQMYQDNNE